MSFLIRRADGSERKVSGYRPGSPPANAKQYRGERLGSTRLPARADLRPFMTTIENQGETNSCTANAVAGAYEYLVKRHLGEEAYDVSRMFIYYNARKMDEDSPEIEDEGSVIQYAIEGLKQHGACSEETWPFDQESVNEEPSEEAYSEAAEFLIESTELVPTRLEAWKKALAEGYPIIFGIRLYNSFDSHRRAGLVPMPSPSEASRESHGGHAMLAVGYSDKDQVFIVRNSWGEEWGDNGYCYIPYRYLMNERFNGGDSWIIKRLENVPTNEGTWSDDDESVIESLDHELANMSDEDYGALLDAMGEYPLEARIALLFLHAAGADGEVSDEEMNEISGYLDELLGVMGVRTPAAKLLRRAQRDLRNEALLQETIELFGEHLTQAVLAGITSKLEEVVGSDDTSEEEREFLDELVTAWQIEASGDEDEEEGDEEEGDEDDEDEEGDDEDEEEGDEDEDDEEEDEEEEDE